MVANVDLLEHLPRLIEYLRHYDYRLTVEDELRLLTLSDEVQLRGGSALDIEALRQIVSPLVCRNPDEQERLPQVLALWQRLSLGAKSPAPDLPDEGASVRRNWRRQVFWIVSALATVLLLGLAYWYIDQWWLQPTPTGKGPGAAAVSAQAVDERGTMVDWRPLARGVLAFVPLVAAGIIFFRRRRTPSLSRGPAPRDAAAFALNVVTAESPLFRPGSIQAALRDLRRHRQVPSGDLDVGRTVAATARSAGFVQFVQGRRFVLPDYLLLIDRASGKDHFGELGDVLASRLQAEQFRATRAEYFGDPRRLRIKRSDGSWRQCELARMAVDQADVRLLLVADVADFWDPVRRQWRDWVATLRMFETVAVLTPIPRSQWGKRERALIQAGFMIVPATSEGIGRLAHDLRLEGEMDRVGHGATGTERLDALLASDPYLWSGDTPPPEWKIQEMVEALRDALEDAFLYLCALAVFPAINPRLTEQVGVMLRLRDDRPAISDERYGAIARLPWLRRARMPDWVRKALIEAMRPDDAARVRAVWVSLLSKKPDSVRHGVALDVVGATPARDALRRLLRAFRRGDDSSFAERILLAFLAGKDLPDLSLAAPDRLGDRRRLPAPDRFDGFIAFGALAVTAAWLWWGDATLGVLGEWLKGMPRLPRILAAPALMSAAAAMAAWHDRIKGGRSLIAGVLAIAALLASLLPLVGGQAIPAAPGTAFAILIGALGAAAYVFSPSGLRERTLAGVDPMRVAAGDRWWVTSLVLLSTFGGGASILALANSSPPRVASIDWAWPASLAANFVLVWLGTRWFQKRIGAPDQFARVTATAATALTAVCGGLAHVLLYTNIGALDALVPIQDLAPSLAVEIILFVPWVVGLGIFLRKAPGRQNLQAILGASVLAAVIGVNLAWLPIMWNLPASSVLIPISILNGILLLLPIPLIMTLCACRSAGVRTRAVKTMIFGVGVMTFLFLAPLFALDGLWFDGSIFPSQLWMLLDAWNLPLAISWPMLRWLAPGLAGASANLAESSSTNASKASSGASRTTQAGSKTGPMGALFAALAALTPAVAVSAGLVSIPPSIFDLARVVSFSVSAAFLVAAFLLRDRIRNMRNRLALILSLFAAASGAACAVGYVQFTNSHTVVFGPEVYIVPLNPSTEISEILAQAGNAGDDYAIAMIVSPESERLRQLMSDESLSSGIIMIGLLVFAQAFFIGAAVITALRLLGTKVHSQPAVGRPVDAPIGGSEASMAAGETTGRRLGRTLWIGMGVAAILSVLFFGRYLIEVGLLTPDMRMIVAALFGVALIGVGEIVRSGRLIAANPRLAQPLVGAGVAALYATLYGSHALFALIGSGTASVAMEAVTVTALALSFRHGAPIAVLGMVGGFLTPLFVGDPDGGAVPLLLYLAVLDSVLFVIAWRRAWPWLAATAIALSFAWSCSLITRPTAEALGAFLFVILLAFAASLVRPGERKGYLSGLVRSLGLGAAFASIPVFAQLASLQPPWPGAVAYISAALIVVGALVAREVAAMASRRLRSLLFRLGSTLTVAGLSGYLYFYSTLAVTLNNGERLVLGFACNAEAQQIYGALCPHLTEAELAAGEYDLSAFFTPGSITAARLSLLAAWLVLTCGLIAVVAWAAVRNRTVTTAVSSEPQFAA